MKKAFYILAVLFLMSEVAYLFTRWGEVDYLNITGLSLICLMGIVGQKMKDLNE